MMSKAILKTAGYTNFFIRDTYFIDRDHNSVYVLVTLKKQSNLFVKFGRDGALV